MLTLVVRRLAVATGAVATPRQDRWHSKPTALFGGIAIYVSFVIAFFVFTPKLTSAYPILAAGTLLFIAGLVDDLAPIKPYTKLIVQLTAAAIVVYFNLQLPWTSYGPVNSLITIFWLVSITNAINLLDNMDGLAGGVSLIACIVLTVTFIMNGQVAESMMPALLGGALLGFLVFNFNPASIFMGDCGSMFIGFMLSGMALLSNSGRFRDLASVLLTPVLILLLPIFDTTIVLVMRKLGGRSIAQGGCDHTSHRLVALGMTERRTVVLLYLFAAVSGALALTMNLLRSQVILLLVPLFALIVLFFGLYLGKVRVYAEEDVQAGNTILSRIAEFQYKRRILEVLLDVVLVVLAYYGAYILRFDGDIPDEQLEIFEQTVALVIIITMLSLLLGGVYRGIWRYAGIDDLIVMAKSVFLGAATSSVVILAIHGFVGPSRAVLILNAILLFVLLGASRLSFRLFPKLIPVALRTDPAAKFVLIYGAGDGGALLIREILNNPEHCYAPVGFIDDDARKTGKLLHGYRIFHSRDLPKLIRTRKVDEVLISSLKISQDNLASLRVWGLPVRRMSIKIEEFS